MPPTASLDVTDVIGHRQVAIATSPFTIGRRETNALRLGGAEVSREHAHIVLDNGRYVLRDRGSKFGTFVNGARIIEHSLQSGDRIRFGRDGGSEAVFDSGGTGSYLSMTSGISSSPITDVHLIAMLLDALRALGHAQVLQEILALVLDSALTLSGAERGFIMLASPSGALEFRLARNRNRETLDASAFSTTSRKIPDTVFATGRTEAINNLMEGDNDEHDMTRALGIRHVFCAPLHLVRFADIAESAEHGKRIGVLYLDGSKQGKLLSETVQSALETLAAEAAVAIENARLYREALAKATIEQELRIAADIQRTLLPRAAIERPCVEAAAANEPCRLIGGDFFDYAHQEDCRFAFTLGDVAGKGPAAALLSSLLLGMFSLAAQGSGAPSSVVCRVNRALCDRGIEARFATLFYGVLDRHGRLHYCNAGHNAPFVIGASGVSRLTVGGPPVGLLSTAQYEDEIVQLQPGDRVVVFSDGVSEALSQQDEEFGDERILDALQCELAASSDTAATALVNALFDRVRAFTAGAIQNDDITAMALRYRGPDEE